MNTDDLLLEKIGKLLEPLIKRLSGLEHGLVQVVTRLDGLEQGQKNLEQGQATGNTVLKAIGAGHQNLVAEVKTIRATMATKKDVDTTVDVAVKELKADIFMLDAKLMRKVQSHERRIDNLERNTNTPNPDKH